MVAHSLLELNSPGYSNQISVAILGVAITSIRVKHEGHLDIIFSQRTSSRSANITETSSLIHRILREPDTDVSGG